MFKVKYVSSDSSCSAGMLISKRRAPVCYLCGRVLWTPVSKGDFGYGRAVKTHNAKGERLGFMPMLGKDDRPRCWNSKQCLKRSQRVHND